MDKLIHTLEMLAKEKSDGHFTIMKFTTDWAVCLGTVTDGVAGDRNAYDATKNDMYHGKTLEEAVCRLIRSL